MPNVAGIVQYSNKIDGFCEDEAISGSRPLSPRRECGRLQFGLGPGRPARSGTGSGAFGRDGSGGRLDTNLAASQGAMIG
jgi:hypothetical protein